MNHIAAKLLNKLRKETREIAHITINKINDNKEITIEVDQTLKGKNTATIKSIKKNNLLLGSRR